MRTRATILLVALTLAGCSTGLPPDVAKLAYVDRDNRFALDLPQGWTVRESTGPTCVMASAPESGPHGGANVDVTVTRWSAGLSLDEFVAAGREVLARLPGYRLVSEGPAQTADGKKAFIITFDDLVPGRPVRQEQMYVVGGQRAYVVTASALPGDFEAEQKNFEICFRSFRAGW